jgi:rubrerythrin
MAEDSLENVLMVAIEREQEASRFYEAIALKASDLNVREIFQKLAAEEREHERLLWKSKGDATLNLKFHAPRDLKIAETVDMPELTVDMKPAEAIQWAMKKELQAAEFYRGLASLCLDGTVRSAYENLANMELGHKHRLENLFVDTGYPEAW